MHLPALAETGPTAPARASRRATLAWSIALCASLLAGCGGGGGAASGEGTPPPAGGGGDTGGGGSTGSGGGSTTVTTLGQRGAVRLAHQASFGPTEAEVQRMASQSAAGWVEAQMRLSNARYRSGGTGDIDRNTMQGFCERGSQAGNPNCWRDNFSTEPLLWDFYRNALTQPDQLRQRVAFALSQIVVVSGVEVDGTYGHRGYQNMLLDQAFGNYREVLRRVALSPVMGEYLDNVNNDRSAPNENFAREMLQLFSIGTCALNLDGSLKGGRCEATYNNETVRAYAYALTGWTYPTGGTSPWGCWPEGANCRYMDGDMVPAAALRDRNARTLMSGVTVAADTAAPQALNQVLDSLLAHPNMAPFIGRQLIQHLVTANPSAAYVQRVSQAFVSGSYSAADGASTRRFGSGQRGDLAATVAAVLLDDEARRDAPPQAAGRLRDPALMMTTVLRALNGRSDGAPMSWWWGGDLRQHMFRSPSVFNFYPPDFPLAGTDLVGPAFAIHGATPAFARLNFLVYLLDWNGSDPDPSIPNAVPTRIDTTAFLADADNPAALVDRLSMLAYGEVLPAASRAKVVSAVTWYDASNHAETWRERRVRTAAYLVFAAPQFQVAR